MIIFMVASLKFKQVLFYTGLVYSDYVNPGLSLLKF